MHKPFLIIIFLCRDVDTEIVFSMKVATGLIFCAKKRVFLYEAELVIRICGIKYRTSRYFFSLPSDSKRKKKKSKLGKPPELELTNKHKKNLVSETRYTKNPCWGVGYYWDLISNTIVGEEPIIQVEGVNQGGWILTFLKGSCSYKDSGLLFLFVFKWKWKVFLERLEFPFGLPSKF